MTIDSGEKRGFSFIELEKENLLEARNSQVISILEKSICGGQSSIPNSIFKKLFIYLYILYKAISYPSSKKDYWNIQFFPTVFS